MSCDFHEPFFGATYPDACCIDGFLWDLDSCDEPGGALSSGGDVPCPQCNHAAWLEGLIEHVTEEGSNDAEDHKPRTYTCGKWRFQKDEDQSAIEAAYFNGYDEQAALNQSPSHEP